MQKIQVVLAEDHELFRDGLDMLLQSMNNIELLGIATHGQELVELCKTHYPSVVITDIKMPIMDGIEATKVLTTLYPNLGIIGLSMYDDAILITDFLEAGGKGYLLKDATRSEFEHAIVAVNSRRNYYCQRSSAVIREHLLSLKNKSTADSVQLNDIELSILKLICDGLTSKEIGETIFLSPRTIESYRLKLLHKLNVSNTTGLVIYAIKNGIV